jgi:hypothetical protein
MTQCHKSFKIKKLRIFCKDHRPFAHPSGDNLDLALKACKKAVCFI